MIYVIVFLLSVLISSISQILLKKSAEKECESFILEYLNTRVVISYGMFFISTLLTMYAYRGVNLSFGTLLESVGYIYVPILSCLFLGEKITRLKIVGAIFIILGICCYALL